MISVYRTQLPLTFIQYNLPFALGTLLHDNARAGRSCQGITVPISFALIDEPVIHLLQLQSCILNQFLLLILLWKTHMQKTFIRLKRISYQLVCTCKGVTNRQARLDSTKHAVTAWRENWKADGFLKLSLYKPLHAGKGLGSNIGTVG